MVPGGLVQPARRRARARRNLLVLAARDALVAACSATGRPSLRVADRPRRALVGALTYAAAIAIGAAALRAMEIPRLVGPALLTLVFYLWDAFIGTAPVAPPRRALDRPDRRCSAVLGLIVVAWNLLLRG